MEGCLARYRPTCRARRRAPGLARRIGVPRLSYVCSISGPGSPQRGRALDQRPWTLLTAVDLLTGQLLVIKILPRHDERYKLSAIGEKGALEDLQLNTFSLEGPLVRMELIKVGLEGDSARAVEVGPGEYEALKMRRFVGVLSELPQLSDKLIYEGGLRLVDALERMHAAGRVHCDVKGPNVLLTENGHWYLGDYGASVKVGSKVWSCTQVSADIQSAEEAYTLKEAYTTHGTPSCLLHALRLQQWLTRHAVCVVQQFYPGKSVFMPADPKLDWGMLTVLLLVEHKKKTKVKHLVTLDLRGMPHVTLDKVQAACQDVRDPQLRGLLEDVVARAGWSWVGD